MKNKKILFIAPDFHLYSTKIVSELKKMGFLVDYLHDRPKYYSIFNKLGSNIRKLSWSNHRRKIEKMIKNNTYDIIFVIKGECIDHRLALILKDNKKDCFKIMYQWDSIDNFDYRPILFAFDKCYTFDFEDAVNLDLCQESLFYIENESNIDKCRSIDILFVGGMHGERNKQLSLIRNANRNYKYKIHLYIPLLTFLKLKFIGDDISYKEVSFYKVSYKEMLKLYQNSKVVLDFQSEVQTGLTIRTFESLGNGCKLITSNNYIRESNIYNKDFIHILPEDGVIINEDFIYSKPSCELISDYYKIDNWLKRIINTSC
ncbi:TPA: glycosyltransferase family protein [Photobacterium damselae]